MRIGVPCELKEGERRVAITPAGVRELTLAGHRVLVEQGAGAGCGIADEDYRRAGARMVADPAEVWGQAALVLKVKEPLPSEHHHLRADLTLFTFLHLAPDQELTRALVESGCTAIAYETVEDGEGGLPLLAPMSEVAGRMAPQVGAAHLEQPRGGRGILLGGVSGVAPAHVVIVGAGTAGSNAAWLASGMEAHVTILDLDVGRLRYIDSIHRGGIATLMSNRLTVEELVPRADLLVGAVLVPGARTPKVVAEEIVAGMRPGSVVIDISIDQGGCVETSRMTTHQDPTYVKHGVVHYAVGNMPGAVPHTSTYALTNVTLPYAARLAGGVREALAADPGLLRGVNVARGTVTNQGVADAHGLAWAAASEVLDL